jgi:hypothetical protein
MTDALMDKFLRIGFLNRRDSFKSLSQTSLFLMENDFFGRVLKIVKFSMYADILTLIVVLIKVIENIDFEY